MNTNRFSVRRAMALLSSEEMRDAATKARRASDRRHAAQKRVRQAEFRLEGLRQQEKFAEDSYYSAVEEQREIWEREGRTGLYS